MVVVAGSVVGVLLLVVEDGGSEDVERRQRLFGCSEVASEGIMLIVKPCRLVIRGRRCVEVALT